MKNKSPIATLVRNFETDEQLLVNIVLEAGEIGASDKVRAIPVVVNESVPLVDNVVWEKNTATGGD